MYLQGAVTVYASKPRSSHIMYLYKMEDTVPIYPKMRPKLQRFVMTNAEHVTIGTLDSEIG
jgi:hypothetical protein